MIEEKEKTNIKPIKLGENYLFMLLSEESLKKTWNNKHDKKWDVIS